ncbi:MAG TPA: FAD-dependent oxidoreductase [Dermatophilaceae bacterium]|nr:FAD-dependent oxidoreductase [Dermatophilaceae bacterium]
MAGDDKGTLIVGAGQSGLALATSLRELGDEDRIVLVGEEVLPPYERPPLSKAYLQHQQDRETLVFHPRDWYAGHGIELVTGDPVVSIERDTAGGVATTAAGARIEFSRLALATGSINRTLTIEGVDLPGVLALRTVEESEALARALAQARRLVVIGGGFIGLEVAAAARLAGLEVTVIEVGDRLLGRAASEDLSDFYLRAHERRGVRILLGARVGRLVAAEDRVAGVHLSDGRTIPADAVLVAVGAAARTELAEALALEVADGIVVDEYALASDGLTVAVGDCTTTPSPYVRGIPGHIRLESVQHATDHARAAAATLLGDRTAYGDVPWFWSDQGDLKLKIVGLVAGHDHTVVRGDLDADVGTESFALLHYRDGVLVACESVNRPQDHLAVKRGLEKGLTIDPDAAADADVPLKRLLVALPHDDHADGADTPDRSTTSGS